MARTLPWLKSSSATKTSTRRPQPAHSSKRQRLLDPSSPSNPHSPKKLPHQPPTARSPSTSPPPAPPTQEFMRPGLDADDIYIMVEDEFLSTAHTFTAHLHHAEYIRLKNLARDRNASTISSISRPVDSITAMRAETKKKKEAERQEQRMRRAVESVVPRKALIGKGGDGEEGSEESDFDPNEGQQEPWEGTQLQGFMRKSPRKGLEGLTGLQKVTANTRAAAGFERPERRNRAVEGVGSPTPMKKAKEQGKAPIADVEDSTSESDDDDLDAPSRAASRAPASISKPAPTRKTKPVSEPNRPIPKTHPPSPPRAPPKRSFLDLTPLPKAPPPITRTTPTKKTLELRPDPMIEPQIIEDSKSSLNRAEIIAARRRLKLRKEKQEGRKSSGMGMKADEIPIFLV